MQVRGVLSGPGLAEGAEVITMPGRPLELGTAVSSVPGGQASPPLSVPGTYTLDDLRLTTAEGATILAATPAVVPISVVDKVLVSNVTSRPLSLEEIQDRGIVIDESNYTAFEFTFKIETESGSVTIPFDVAFPQDEETLEGDGAFGFPPILPGLNVPNLGIEGIVLEHEPLDVPVDIPPIPGVIVIPGNVAFLNQFFQVLLVVSNVAPPGSQLVVTSATAELVLPPGDNGVPEDADDPLAPARTAEAPEGSLSTLVLNTTTQQPPFGPGEEASGEFLVEGRRVGTHRVKVTIIAELHLVTGQTVQLSGTAFDTVQVRNPNFALTFNHPSVVRAGEAYTLGVTITNISEVVANSVRLTLDPINGATLIGHSNAVPGQFGTAEVPTIRQGDSC